MFSPIMKSLVMVALILVVMITAPGPADAGTDLGQICLQTGGGVGSGVIRLSLTQTAGPAPMVQVVFRLRAVGLGSALFIAGSGVLTDSLVSTGGFDVGLTGAATTVGIASPPKSCSVYAVLSPPAFGGTIELTCMPVSGTGTTSTGTVSIVACPASADAAPSVP